MSYKVDTYTRVRNEVPYARMLWRTSTIRLTTKTPSAKRGDWLRCGHTASVTGMPIKHGR
jgi:hypothetical protein